MNTPRPTLLKFQTWVCMFMNGFAVGWLYFANGTEDPLIRIGMFALAAGSFMWYGNLCKIKSMTIYYGETSPQKNESP